MLTPSLDASQRPGGIRGARALSRSPDLADSGGDSESAAQRDLSSRTLTLRSCLVLQRLRPLSYSKSHVILIAFALDTPDSLENVTVKWIEEVRELCGPSIPVLLIGLKMDLRDEAMQQGGGERGRFVTTEQVRPPRPSPSRSRLLALD